MPQMVTLEETTEVFLKSCNYKTVEEFFQGFLNKKLVYAILQRLKIDPRKPVAQISRKDLNRILDMIQHFEVEIKGYKGYDPEGDVSSYYPVTQVYTFGVDIKF